MKRQWLQEVVQNILDEPIPEKVKQWLLKPLRICKGGKPIAPLRREQETRRQVLLEEPHGNQTITNYQNDLLRLYDALESREEGQHFMRLIFSRRLGQNLTPIIGKLRERVNTAFYLRYLYSYVIVNNNNRRSMVLYKQKRGSPWINSLAVAEMWLNQQETEQATLHNIERSNMKWTLVRFFNVEIKVMLDRQPLLGTGPLPDSLRNLARGCVKNGFAGYF